MIQDYDIPKDVWQATRYYFRAFLLVFVIALLACLLASPVQAQTFYGGYTQINTFSPYFPYYYDMGTVSYYWDGTGTVKAWQGFGIHNSSYFNHDDDLYIKVNGNSTAHWPFTASDIDHDITAYSIVGWNTAQANLTDTGGSAYCFWGGGGIMVTSTAPALSANFYALPVFNNTIPAQVQFYDTSIGYPQTYNWTFGDGYTSSQSNPLHTYTEYGKYTVSLTVSNPYSNSTKTLTEYINIYESGTLHLMLDVKSNTTKSYLEASQIGIYDSEYDVWRNSTCDTGACGFMDSGASHEYPLQLGKTYTIAASHPDYYSNFTNIVLSEDYQLLTMYLISLNPSNLTDVKHLDVDIKSGQSLKYLEDTNYQIYDFTYNVWHNSTCSNGACGWTYTGSSTSPYSLQYGSTYGLYADKFGYQPANQTVKLSYDHQLFTLYLYPETVYNETAHLDIDVRYQNYTPVINADVGLYDYAYGEWRNGSSYNGSTGYIYSGTYPHAYPLQYYTTYKIAASKTGYLPVSKEIVLSYDHQLYTLILYPESTADNIINTTITVLPTPPIYLIPNFTLPTPMPSPDINDTWIINITISPFPTINPYWNTTGMVNPNELKTNIDPFFNPWLNSIDFMFNNTFAYGLSILCFVLSPIITLGLYGVWTTSMISGYQVVFSNYVIFVTYLVTAFVNSIPNKLRNTITFCLLLDIAYQLLTIKKAKL